MEGKIRICGANYIALFILEDVLEISAPSQRQINLIEVLVSIALTGKEREMCQKKLHKLMSEVFTKYRTSYARISGCK